MEQKTLQLHIRLDPVLFHQLKAAADKARIEKSAFVRDVLRKALSGSEQGCDFLGEMRCEIKQIAETMEQLIKPAGGNVENLSIPVISAVLYDIGLQVEGLHVEMQNRKGGK